MRQPIPLIGLLTLTAYLVTGCHRADPESANAPGGEKAQGGQVLNLFWWSWRPTPYPISRSGYNGDFVQARRRANEAKNAVQVGYALPDEGSVVYFNMLAIPRDAPHADNAHRFLNYLMKPEVIADITNFVGYANANLAATPLLDPSIAHDTASYPTAAQRERLFVQSESTPEQARAITRLWQKFKTGQ